MLVEKFECFEKKLDTVLAKHPLALQMERRLGHPKTRLFMYGTLILLSLLLFYLNAPLAHALVALLLPSFATARYLYNQHQAPTGGNKKSERLVSLWMTYWLVLGKLMVLEAMGVTAMVPMYGLLRVALLIWLQAPGFEGAELVRNKVMLPVLDVLFTPSSPSSSLQTPSSPVNSASSAAKKGLESPKSPN